MTISYFGRISLCGCLAAAILAACGAVPPPFDFAQGDKAAGDMEPPIGAPGAMSQPEHGKSWMVPNARKIKKLLYISDLDSDSAYVYNYKTGSQVGQLTGIDNPKNQCVDSKGDIFIASANGENGELVEYAHGGTTPIKTFDTGGYAVGCSVDRRGDVAVVNAGLTGESSGNLLVWRNGSGHPTSYKNSSCYYMLPPGYDDKGNLVLTGYSSDGFYVTVCELPAGGNTLRPLSFNQSIAGPGATMWDGSYITIVDQSGGSAHEAMIWPSKLSGDELNSTEMVTLTDNCDGSQTQVEQPFIVGDKNTPMNKMQGKVLVGINDVCLDDGESKVNYWPYPAGGAPTFSLSSPPPFPTGLSVSIAE